MTGVTIFDEQLTNLLGHGGEPLPVRSSIVRQSQFWGFLSPVVLAATGILTLLTKFLWKRAGNVLSAPTSHVSHLAQTKQTPPPH